MGMFDTVMVPCPQCGTKNEFQSKGGECKLAVYDLEDVPVDVLSDANRYPNSCSKCGIPYKIVIQYSASVARVST